MTRKLTRDDLIRAAHYSMDLSLRMMAENTLNTITGARTMGKKVNRPGQRPSTTAKDETPSEAFIRLAQGRTNKACKAISLIAQLDGSAYERTEVQARAICEALQASVDLVKDTFAGKSKASDKFRLPS